MKKNSSIYDKSIREVARIVKNNLSATAYGVRGWTPAGLMITLYDDNGNALESTPYGNRILEKELQKLGIKKIYLYD